MTTVSTATSVNAITIATAQVGYHEGRDHGHWNNVEKYASEVPGLAWVSTGHYPWCAVFASWVLHRCGALGQLTPSASVSNLFEQGRSLTRFSEYPVVGGVAIYGRSVHTGAPVVRYDDTHIWVVEGNTTTSGSPEGDGVYLRQRRRRDPFVTGYVIPYYDEYATTPDPAWSGRWLGLGPDPTTTNTSGDTSVRVSLSALRSAAAHDPHRPQGGVTAGAADDVRVVERLLVSAGLMARRYAGDGSFGSVTVDAYAAWQRRLGYRGRDADGIPGQESLAKLLATYGEGKYLIAP